MPRGLEAHQPQATAEPQGLWDAMGMLSRIQDEQRFAIAQGDMQRLDQLLTEQETAWGYVREFAERLIMARKAPPDLVDRLRGVLDRHREHEQALETAREVARQRLAEARRRARAQQVREAA